MQSFRLSKSQLSTIMKDFNSQRKQSLKSIKSFYAEIESKQVNIFDNAIQRLQQNLQNFKDNKYKRMHNDIDHVKITKKYEDKLDKIDNQMLKLELIIKNGCGKIVEKPMTSRISINSTTKSPTQSRKSIQDSTNSKNSYNYIQSQQSQINFQNIDDKLKRPM